MTLARAATDTFAGIRPADAVPFIAAQLLGAFAATVLFRWLLPSLPARERSGPAQRSEGAVVSQPHGVPVLESAIPLSQGALDLVKRGVAMLWSRIRTADPRAEDRPLLLSYDVHPTPHGPVLIEVNTNAGGIAAAMWAARHVNVCCAEWEHATLEKRLLALFQRDLLGDDSFPDRRCRDR